MRLFRLELKRILRTKTTAIVIVIAILLSIIMAWLPISFVKYEYNDANGNAIIVSGLKAISAKKEKQQILRGEVTKEKLSKMLIDYQESVEKYGDVYGNEFPQEIYNEKILPGATLQGRIKEAFADATTGMAAELMELSVEDMGTFYTKCHQHLKDLMLIEQANYPAAQKQAIQIYKKVEMPFIYEPGYSTDAADYMEVYIFLLILLSTIVAADIFSAEYQTEADSILRCTKKGRSELAIIKIASALTIFTVMFIGCLAIYIIITNTAFGWETRDTSIQILYSVVCLPALNIGQMQNLMVLLGLVSLLATASFTLLISSKFRNATTSLSLGILFCLLPAILYMTISGNVANWLCSILPTGGAGLLNNFLYTLTNFEFLHVGNFSIWMPYVMITAAIVEIPLFCGLTIYSYCKYKVK